LQSFYQIQIALHVDPPQVIQQPPAARNHAQQSSPRRVVFGTRSHVLRKRINPLGQNRDLRFGRPGIGVRNPVLLDHFLFSLFRDRHLQFLLAAVDFNVVDSCAAFPTE
jgi:hypothetical protein